MAPCSRSCRWSPTTTAACCRSPSRAARSPRPTSDFTLVAGQLEHSKGRNSTDNRSLSIAGANGSSAGSRDSNKFYYAGGDYKVNKDLTLQYYYGNLDDFYKQHFLGLIHNWQIGPGVLKTDLRAFDSSSDGKNGSRSGRADGYVSSGYYGSGVTKGEVDNRAFSGLFTYTVSGHSIGAGYQILNGDSDFPFLNRGDGEGSTAYLITDVQIGKFQRAGERTWQVRYGYDFAGLGLPGLTFNTMYLKGDNIKSGRGDQSEWERDIALAYVIPDGTFKGWASPGRTLRSAPVCRCPARHCDPARPGREPPDRQLHPAAAVSSGPGKSPRPPGGRGHSGRHSACRAGQREQRRGWPSALGMPVRPCAALVAAG